VSAAARPGPEAAASEGAERRTGVYLCRCGANLGTLVGLEELAAPGIFPGAADVAVHDVLCSPEGKAWLEARIREKNVARAVVGACSPREHEATFRGVLAAAGRSPHHLHVANLREGVEWLGGEPEALTRKARRLLGAGLARVALQRPIPSVEVEVSADVLVVGGGVAGLSAARALAGKHRKVVLVERAFVLGGLANRLDEVFPDLACASCFLEPILDEVLHSERIEVLTGAEVRAVRGASGRFSVEVAIRPRHVDPAVCLGCGACAKACPVELADPLSRVGTRRAIGLAYPGCLPHVSALDRAGCLRFAGEGCDACVRACAVGAVRLDEAPRTRALSVGAIVVASGLEPGAAAGPEGVVSTYELERMLHPDGPTGGRLRGAGGRPPRAVLLAAPAADEPVAVDEVLKLAHLVRARAPDARVAVAGGLDRAPHLARRIAALAEEGVEFVAGTLVPGGVDAGSGGLAVRLRHDRLETVRPADLVAVHLPARPANGADALARLLRLDTDARGFVRDGHDPFAPGATRIAGVYVAGAAAGPRPIREAIRDGAAVAGQILASLVPGERRPLEPLAAEVDALLCGGCAICVAACAFGAVTLAPESGLAVVEKLHCRGCGVCAAACPTGAARAPHFERAEIEAEIAALLRSPSGPAPGEEGR
jgi:heterodisulfide reductase subunit A